MLISNVLIVMYTYFLLSIIARNGMVIANGSFRKLCVLHLLKAEGNIQQASFNAVKYSDSTVYSSKLSFILADVKC
jgi:hypothetical protein